MKALFFYLLSFAYANQLSLPQTQAIDNAIANDVMVETVNIGPSKTLVIVGESHVKEPQLAKFEKELINQFSLRFLEGINPKDDDLSINENFLIYLSGLWSKFKKLSQSLIDSTIFHSIRTGISITTDNQLVLGHCYFNYPDIAGLIRKHQFQDIKFITSTKNLVKCPKVTPINYFIELGNLSNYKSNEKCNRLFCDERGLASARDQRMANNIWLKFRDSRLSSAVVVVGKNHVHAIKSLLQTKVVQTQGSPLQLSLHQPQQK